MLIETTNYGFIKDDGDEFYNVLRVNANLDKIDAEIKKVDQKANVTIPVTSVNTKTGAIVLSAGDIKTSENKTIEETLQNHASSLGEMADEMNLKAKFKSGTSAFTTRGFTHIVTDTFCTSSSLVQVVITGATMPQGKWSVNSANGNFTITSDNSEVADIAFNYYITK